MDLSSPRTSARDASSPSWWPSAARPRPETVIGTFVRILAAAVLPRSGIRGILPGADGLAAWMTLMRCATTCVTGGAWAREYTRLPPGSLSATELPSADASSRRIRSARESVGVRRAVVDDTASLRVVGGSSSASHPASGMDRLSSPPPTTPITSEPGASASPVAPSYPTLANPATRSADPRALRGRRATWGSI